MTLDPRTKLVFTACLSTMAVLMNNLVYQGGLLALSLIILLSLKADLKRVFHQIKALLVLIIFIAILQSFFRGGSFLTEEGIILAGEFLFRVLIIIASATILTTSNSRELIQGLIQLKIPYEFAFMTALGIRYLPVFRNEFKDALIAIELRGININGLRIWDRIKVYGGLLQPISAGVLIKSKALSLSIEMRGFRSMDRRSSLRYLKMDRKDYALIIMSIAFTLLALTFYYFQKGIF